MLSNKAYRRIDKCPKFGSIMTRLMDVNTDSDPVICYEMYLTMMSCHEKKCLDPECPLSLKKAIELIEDRYKMVRN